MPAGAASGTARTTALIVTWNAMGLLEELVQTIEALMGTAAVIVVDNCSSDGTPQALEKRTGARTIRSPRNGGFGYGNNIGLRQVRTPYTLLLNSDARIGAREVMALADFLDRNPGHAAVQPLVRLWDWPEVTAGRGLGYGRWLESFDLGFLRFEPVPQVQTPVPLPGVGAAAALFRTAALREAGGFDERFFMYFEDADLCLRLGSAGWKFALLPAHEARHRTGHSSVRNRARRWEMASSALLARKFLGGRRGRLPLGWLSREAKIWAVGAMQLRPPLWRLPGLARALMSAPQQVFDARIPPSPPVTEIPGRRPLPPMVLDEGGSMVSGPGWIRSRPSPAFLGFGAVRSARDGRFKAVVRAQKGVHTCRIWAGRKPGGAFVAGPEPCRIEADMPSGRFYIACDDREDAPVIELLEAGLE